MKVRSVVPMRVAKAGYVLVSLACVFSGLAMLLEPDAVLRLVLRFFGAALLVFGVVKLIGFFSRDLYRLAFEYDLQFGLLLGILGLIAVFRRGYALNLICVVCGICLIAECLFKQKTAAEARAFGLPNWWMTAALSAPANLIGAALILNSGAGAKTSVILLGAALMAEGILNLCVALTMVKIVRNQIPDGYESGDPYEEER